MHKISENLGVTSNSRRHMSDMMQVPYWDPTNIRRHHTKFNRPEQPDITVCKSLNMQLTVFKAACLYNAWNSPSCLKHKLMIWIYRDHQQYKELYGHTRDALSIRMQKSQLQCKVFLNTGVHKSLAPGRRGD